MFFRLHNHCALVEGAARGAIYNFQSGKVHSINASALSLLKECQEQPINELFDIHDSENQPLLAFFQKLTELNMGAVYFQRPCTAHQMVRAPEEKPGLEFLWLELTNQCNNRCLHCYAASAPSEPPSAGMTHERWQEIIREARQAGASAIQLIGGEPLLYPRWRELVTEACHQGYEYIEIFTNATLVEDSDIEFFQAQGVHIATTIYADNPDIHDKVTQNQGSFDQTLSAIHKLKAAGIPLRIASIIMKTNEREAENIMNLCRSLGLDADLPDVIRPTGRGDDTALLPESYTKPPIKPPFYTDADFFAKSRLYHSCLAGKIAITPNGDVIPCIFARHRVCGNVLKAPLNEVLSGRILMDCWSTTKDQVEKCKACEYRYACMDCRPLAQGSDLSHRWLACPTGCSYNPYTGEWEE